MANKVSVWLTSDQIYKALKVFTADPKRQADIRAGLRQCHWRRAWSENYVQFIRGFDKEFADFVRAMAA